MKKLGLFFFFLSLALITSSQNILRTDKLPELVIQGQGKINVLLIPCMSCRWNEWEEYMQRNRERYTMYAITVPGYGGTSAPDLPKDTKSTPYRENLLAGLSELIDGYKLNDVTVIGHSWGTMVAVQLAAKRPDVVSRLIAVDGTIESSSWVPLDQQEQLNQANKVIADWGSKLNIAEEWSKFNGASVGSVLGKKDSITEETMLTRIKLLSSFMATDRPTMLQYWRENMMIDLTKDLNSLTIQVLDIQSFTGEKQSEQKLQHLATLAKANVNANVKSVFMYDTKHFIMYHRPEQLDCLINNFIEGKTLTDYAPISSEYFKEEIMN